LIGVDALATVVAFAVADALAAMVGWGTAACLAIGVVPDAGSVLATVEAGVAVEDRAAGRGLAVLDIIVAVDVTAAEGFCVTEVWVLP
jgi:hypothetical protein